MPNQKLNLKNYDYIIGIDQTGATLNGQPKPLPCAFIDPRKNSIQLGLWLSSFNLESFKNLIPNFLEQKTLIIVDAVLGFPKKLEMNIFEIMTLIGKNQGYGMKAAEVFFNQLKKEYNITGNPLRSIEKKLGANSVFTPYPFQKNVQTGSYRILKDLSSDEKWYNILPFEMDAQFEHHIIEGYPSKAFKELLNTKRSREMFNFFLESLDLAIYRQDELTLDHIDSAILALQAYAKENISVDINSKSEGWIL